MENENINNNISEVKPNSKRYPVLSIIFAVISTILGIGTMLTFGVLTMCLFIGMCFGPPQGLEYGKIFSNEVTYIFIILQIIFGILSIILGKKGRNCGYKVSSTVGIVLASLSLVVPAIAIIILIIT